jgi:hypothetical protein
MMSDDAMVNAVKELTRTVEALVAALLLDPCREGALPEEVTAAARRAKLLIHWEEPSEDHA